MKTYLNCHIVTNHLQQYLQFSAKLKSSKNCQVQIYSNKPIASHSVSKDVLTSLCLLRYIMDVNRRHAWDLTVSSVMQEGDFLWCGSLIPSLISGIWKLFVLQDILPHLGPETDACMNILTENLMSSLGSQRVSLRKTAVHILQIYLRFSNDVQSVLRYLQLTNVEKK